MEVSLRYRFLFLLKRFFKKNVHNQACDSSQRFVANGHFYSPVPSLDDEARYMKFKEKDITSAIDLNLDNQLKLLSEYKKYCEPDMFSDSCKEGLKNPKKTIFKRFYNNNNFFSNADAFALHAFMRHFKPAHIIEVGSGFSSAMILDTADFLLGAGHKTDVTFIEPYPYERLLKLTDRSQINLYESKLQDISADIILDKLEPGDLLFVDSSHVLKYNSDVMYLFNKILPNIKPGVFVHFHDIFFPFEYPDDWVKKGRHWNETFFLKQFLSYNDSFEIVFWGSALENKCAKLPQLPLFRQYGGASIYIKRIV